jgi:hypothetical protein
MITTKKKNAEFEEKGRLFILTTLRQSKNIEWLHK